MMDLNRAITEQAVRVVRETPIGQSLQHYASPYYDPVKAKEYYDRTKKLKGDRDKKTKAEALTKKEQKVYDVARDSMSAERQKEVEKTATEYDDKVKAISERAQSIASSFSTKLRNLSVTKELPLNEIPKNATPRQRELLTRENDKIRAKAKKDAVAERKKIGEGLRQELNKAREAYKTGMEAIKTKYEAADTAERKNIKAKVK